MARKQDDDVLQAKEGHGTPGVRDLTDRCRQRDAVTRPGTVGTGGRTQGRSDWHTDTAKGGREGQLRAPAPPRPPFAGAPAKVNPGTEGPEGPGLGPGTPGVTEQFPH